MNQFNIKQSFTVGRSYPGVHYNCTWKTNENDNVVTLHAHSMVASVEEPIDGIDFEFYVFR